MSVMSSITARRPVRGPSSRPDGVASITEKLGVTVVITSWSWLWVAVDVLAAREGEQDKGKQKQDSLHVGPLFRGLEVDPDSDTNVPAGWSA